jgi:hypothetical protein
VSSINPFSGYLAAGGQVERANAADKSHQIRRQQQLSKNIAQQDDAMEHQVESSDAVTPAQDQQKPRQHQQRQSKKKGAKPKHSDDNPHVDVKA